MINRRSFMKWLACNVATMGFISRSSAAEISSGQRAIRWRVPKVYYETVKREFRFEGEIKAGDKDEKGLPLVFIFVGVALLPYLAKAVLALRREIVYGGVVIDTRGETIDIVTDKSLSSGVIIVVSPEGTNLYERDEIENPTELVDVLLKAK